MREYIYVSREKILNYVILLCYLLFQCQQTKQFPLNENTLENGLKFPCKGTSKILGSYIFLGKDDNLGARNYDYRIATCMLQNHLDLYMNMILVVISMS